MPMIGNMHWRIGRTLDIERQIAWTQQAGFDGVGLHAAPGTPGRWRGVEPADCGGEARARLRQSLAAFAFVEIHAPFAINLQDGNLADSLVALEPVMQFAHDLGASVVTVHAILTDADGAGWRGAMQELNDIAGDAQTVAALEIIEGFGAVAGWDLPHVGVNLDVGHMILPAYEVPLKHHGGFRPLIRSLGPTLRHLHLHDVAGELDHIEIGTGEVAFEDIVGGLADIHYAHNATLEMNPDRVKPAGIRRSLGSFREFLTAGGGAR